MTVKQRLRELFSADITAASIDEAKEGFETSLGKLEMGPAKNKYETFISYRGCKAAVKVPRAFNVT
eukprot:2523006-Lingulodinium_polyedra.AAC.1